MGSCCGTQKQNAQKNIGKNQVPVLLKQQQPQQQQQQDPSSQQQQQQQDLQNQQNKDVMKYVDQNIENQIQNKQLPNTHNIQQDEAAVGLNFAHQNNQVQGDAQRDNRVSLKNNSHNIYSAKSNADNSQINGPSSNRMINAGGQSSKQDIIDSNQLQLQFNEIQAVQTGGIAGATVNKESARQTNGVHNLQQEQQIQQQQIQSLKKNVQVKSQNNMMLEEQGQNLQEQSQGIGNIQVNLMKGESIDNVEQILQNKPKSQERNSQNNRSSIHKENYQQLTNSIIARNDIFIFSNQAFQKQVNSKKQKGFELYCYFTEKESKLYFHEFMKMQTKSTHGSTLGDLDQNNNFSSQANQFSTFQDWTKLIEKHQAAQVTKVLDKDSKIRNNPNQDIFQSIIGMKERAWYDELVQIYKVKQFYSSF